MRLHRLRRTDPTLQVFLHESPKLAPLMLITDPRDRVPGQIFESDWHLFRAYINSNSLLVESEQRAGKLIYEGFLDALGALATKVGGGIQAAGKAVADSAKNLSDLLGKNLKTFVDTVGQKIDDVIAWAITNVPGGKSIYDFITKTGARIEDFLNEVFKRAKNALADFVEKGREILVDKVIGLVAKDESVKNELAKALGIDEPLIDKCGKEIAQAQVTGEDPDGETAEGSQESAQTESYAYKKKIIRESILEGFDKFALKQLLGDSLTESKNVYRGIFLERDLREFFGFGDDEEEGEGGGDEGDGEEEEEEEGEPAPPEPSACGVRDLFDKSSIPQFKPAEVLSKGEKGVKNAMKFAGTMQKMFTGALTGGDLEAAARGALASVFEKVFDIWYQLGAQNAKRYFEPLLQSQLFQRFKSGFMTALGGIMGIASSVDLEFDKVSRYIQAIVDGAKTGDAESKTAKGEPYFESMMMENSAALLKDLLLGLIKGSNIENVVRGLVGDPTAIKRFISNITKSLKGAIKKVIKAQKNDMFKKFFADLPFGDIMQKYADKFVEPIFAGIDKLLPD